MKSLFNYIIESTTPNPMKPFVTFLLLLAATPVMAQQNEAPYPVHLGERVRVFLTPSSPLNGMAGGPYIGSVQLADADSLVLLFDRGQASIQEAFSWRSVDRLDRSAQNRTGEALGLLIGGLVGGLVGYVGGDALSDDPLAKVALVPGALIGMLAGGVIGAQVGNQWEDIPPTRASISFRMTFPTRYSGTQPD